MNRIIAFDVCSAAVLFFLIFSLFLRKATKGRANKIFLWLISLVFISAISNISTVIFPYYNNAGEANYILLNFLTYIYFFSRNLTAPVFVLYTFAACGAWHKFKTKRLFQIVWGLPVAVICVALTGNLVFKNIFYISPDLVYHRGQQIIIMYLNSMFILIESTAAVFSCRKLMNRSKFWVLLSLVPMSVIGVAIQFLNPKLMLEIFCTAFPMLLITLVVQKPEEIINTATGTLNDFAFREEVRRNFVTKTSMKMIFVQIQNYEGLRKQFRENVLNAFQIELVRKLYSICGEDETDVYAVSDGYYVIVSVKENEDFLTVVSENVQVMLSEKFKIAQVELFLDSKICAGSVPEDLNDVNTVINFCRHFDSIIPETNKIVSLSEVASSKDFLIRINLDDIIKNAISEKKFQMYYQPIYNIKKKRFTSAEALIRLIDDKYGFISPGLFIPAAEVSGAIHQIGDFVFEEVCRFISQCNFEEMGLEYIEINLSVAQAIEFNLPEKLSEIMKQYNVSPDKINLEITETAADFNPEVFDRNIGAISDMNVSFSLDDYGTGYSNIKRVTSLPLKIIKLDKSFVDEYKEEKMNIVIRENVSMLKKMNKVILVEGVEDKDEFEYFQNLGCDYIQGFYFSKPRPAMDYIQFLNEKNQEAAV